MKFPVLRSPLLAVCIVLTALMGVAIIGVGVGSLVANTGTFGLGVAGVLFGYGALLLLFAWMTLKAHAWALGLIVASSLLHACAVGSFLTTQDRTQVIVMLIVAPFVAATVITSVLAVGRRELDKLATPPTVSS